jgi:hypothetical protein
MPGKFQMQQTVAAAVEKSFEENFRKAATETIANDLLALGGVRVKL